MDIPRKYPRKKSLAYTLEMPILLRITSLNFSLAHHAAPTIRRATVVKLNRHALPREKRRMRSLIQENSSLSLESTLARSQARRIKDNLLPCAAPFMAPRRRVTKSLPYIRQIMHMYYNLRYLLAPMMKLLAPNGLPSWNSPHH